MPQSAVNNECRRRGTSRNTCKANIWVSSQAPGTGLINRAVVLNGRPASAPRTGEGTPAGTLNSTKKQHVVNGYIDRGYNGKSTKAAATNTLRIKGSNISGFTDASSAGRVRIADIPGGSSVNGVAGADAVSLPCNSDQMAPESSVAAAAAAAAAKKQKRRNKFRRKRNTKVFCPENPTPPLVPPQEEEDWENEIQEVTLTDWQKMCFGVRPYGPEDVLNFSLRDLTLKQRETVDLPVTANYSPAVHHPQPVRWWSCSIPTESEQFADAD